MRGFEIHLHHATFAGGKRATNNASVAGNPEGAADRDAVDFQRRFAGVHQAELLGEAGIEERRVEDADGRLNFSLPTASFIHLSSIPAQPSNSA